MRFGVVVVVEVGGIGISLWEMGGEEMMISYVMYIFVSLFFFSLFFFGFLYIDVTLMWVMVMVTVMVTMMVWKKWGDMRKEKKRTRNQQKE